MPRPKKAALQRCFCLGNAPRAGHALPLQAEFHLPGNPKTKFFDTPRPHPSGEGAFVCRPLSPLPSPLSTLHSPLSTLPLSRFNKLKYRVDKFPVKKYNPLNPTKQMGKFDGKVVMLMSVRFPELLRQNFRFGRMCPAPRCAPGTLCTFRARCRR